MFGRWGPIAFVLWASSLVVASRVAKLENTIVLGTIGTRPWFSFYFWSEAHHSKLNALTPLKKVRLLDFVVVLPSGTAVCNPQTHPKKKPFTLRHGKQSTYDHSHSCL